MLAVLLLSRADAQVAAGAPAPDFARVDLDGRPVSLGGLHGRIVLLDFWATWCAPCIDAAPRLIDLQARYRDRGVQVLGMSMDDDAAPVRALRRQFHFDYPLIMGDAELGRRYGVYGLPEQLLIGRDGRVLKIWKGDVPFDSIASEVARAAVAPRRRPPASL